MYLSQFDIDRNRRALSLGLPVSHDAMVGILDATDGEREQAVQDAREKCWDEKRAELKDAEDRATDMEEERDRANDTIEQLQDRISELMDGDTRNAMTAKLEALQSEVFGALDSFEGFVRDARSMATRRHYLRELRAKLCGAFASAMPPRERQCSAA